MSSAQHKTVRLPGGLLARLEAQAKAQGIKVSAAMRIALQRGVAAMEHEAGPAPAPPMVPRRSISKGRAMTDGGAT